jgi:hypothetical protein
VLHGSLIGKMEQKMGTKIANRPAVRKAAYEAPRAIFVALKVAERLMNCGLHVGDCGTAQAYYQ